MFLFILICKQYRILPYQKVTALCSRNSGMNEWNQYSVLANKDLLEEHVRVWCMIRYVISLKTSTYCNTVNENLVPLLDDLLSGFKIRQDYCKA